MHNENPEIMQLINMGVDFIEKDIESFKQIRGCYILRRQTMFLENQEEITELINRMNNNDHIAAKKLIKSINKIKKKISYIENSNLSTEFNIQVINHYLSIKQAEYLMSKANDEKEAKKITEHMKECVKKQLKGLKVEFLDGELDYLVPIKKNLMNLLDVKEKDFNMNFLDFSLVRSIC